MVWNFKGIGFSNQKLSYWIETTIIEINMMSERQQLLIKFAEFIDQTSIKK